MPGHGDAGHGGTGHGGTGPGDDPHGLRGLGRATPERAREFDTTRRCAVRALHALGVEHASVPRGQDGAPVWPERIRGSLTHCAGYRAAAVAPADTVDLLGIDAEPNRAISPRALTRITTEPERGHLASLDAPAVALDRLVFCIKESIYKAWYPRTGEHLGFRDARVTVAVGGSSGSGEFAAQLRGGHRVAGQWLVGNGLIVVATYSLQTPLQGETSSSPTQ